MPKPTHPIEEPPRKEPKPNPDRPHVDHDLPERPRLDHGLPGSVPKSEPGPPLVDLPEVKKR